jgi:sulfide:quinone oxidoreductase
MQTKHLTSDFSVAAQIGVDDLPELAAQGIKTIVCNRPDGEAPDQPSFAEIEKAAAAAGIACRYVPVSGKVTPANIAEFKTALGDAQTPVLAYCRSGTRCATLWALSELGQRPQEEIASKTLAAGYDVRGALDHAAATSSPTDVAPTARHDIVIVGGGAAGGSVAASLLRRNQNLDIAIIDPADMHYYQPGWTMVGGGIFDAASTARPMVAALPHGITRIKAAVTGFDPDNNTVVIEGGKTIRYNHLIVCPGIKLNWNGVEGLSETLGQNGVTSNYRFDLAPYTWELVRSLKSGRALFTQPAMPIKCAGAPQKAMYLSADHWRRNGILGKFEVEFYSPGGVLFSVPEYVPALMQYVERYNAALKFSHNLIAIDGPGKTATFKKTDSNGNAENVETRFDMIHVTPPQTAPDFIRSSPLADAGGWVDVDPATLRHKKYRNIFGLGDAINAPNAKTAAAARKQAPVVAENVLYDKGQRPSQCAYDGYGACPLTVERGRIVLAEFTYGGKVAPSFPHIIDGTKATRAAWILKERVLPPVYWNAMLKGREWLAKPRVKA